MEVLHVCIAETRHHLLDQDLNQALPLKAAHSHQSISDLVNDAVREALREDRDDLASFDERVAEPIMTYEALLDDLKAHDKL